MNALEKALRIRDTIDAVCKAIDAGEVQPTEVEMLALATLVNKHAGVLRHDLVCQLASRCKNGKNALRDISQ